MYIQVDVVDTVSDSQTGALALGSISPSQTFGVPVRLTPTALGECLSKNDHWVMSGNEEII